MNSLTYSIGDQLTIGLTINGQVYPLNGGAFEEISVVQNAICNLPTFQAILKDSSGQLIDNFSIKDGTPIKIVMGNSSGVRTMNFRVYGQPIVQPLQGDYITKLVGYLDFPVYLLGLISSKEFFGTSGSIVGSIASDCGFKNLDIDVTDDSMLWNFPFKTYANFIKYLTKYAYASNTSAFSSGVSLDSTLHFKDIAALVKGNPKTLFYWGKPSDTSIPNYPALLYKIKTLSGIMNKFAGYSMGQNQEQLDGSYEELKTVNATRQSNYLDMNKEIKDTIGNTRIEYFPPDCGNTHSSYEVAKHQNSRILSTFSTLVEFVTDEFTDVKLFDLCKWEAMNTVTRDLNISYSAPYLVCASRATATKLGFYEKIRLITQGKQLDNNSCV